MIENIIYQAKVIRTKFVSDKKYLTKRFVSKLGYIPNFNAPQSFNEKVTARMIFSRDSLHTKLADKAVVRKLVAEKIGWDYFVPLIGLYKSYDDIKFEQFPDKFVLKCNHDSGSAIICNNRNNFDVHKARLKINKHLSMNMYYLKREWHYKNIQPMILAEQYIDLFMDINNQYIITTCRIHCFEGKPEYLEVDIIDNLKNEYSNIYDTSWLLQPFKVDLKENAPNNIGRPPQLEKLLELSESLCFSYGYSRIDFLLSQDQVFFSEITLTPNAGRMIITPIEWDQKLGSLWKSC